MGNEPNNAGLGAPRTTDLMTRSGVVAGREIPSRLPLGM